MTLQLVGILTVIVIAVMVGGWALWQHLQQQDIAPKAPIIAPLAVEVYAKHGEVALYIACRVAGLFSTLMASMGGIQSVGVEVDGKLVSDPMMALKVGKYHLKFDEREFLAVVVNDPRWLAPVNPENFYAGKKLPDYNSLVVGEIYYNLFSTQRVQIMKMDGNIGYSAFEEGSDKLQPIIFSCTEQTFRQNYGSKE